MSNEKAVRVIGSQGVAITTMDDAWRLSQALFKEGLAPKSLKTTGQVLIAMQTGMEVGLTPIRAVNSVVVINGAPTWKGDAAVALILGSGVAESPFTTTYTGEGDEVECTVSTRRMGVECRGHFSVVQAKRADLWGKAGPWTSYPRRMLYYRALGFLVRDHFSDVLFGIRITEEARDIPQEAQTTPKAEDPLLIEALSADVDEAPFVDIEEEEEPPAPVVAPEVDDEEEPSNGEIPVEEMIRMEWVDKVRDALDGHHPDDVATIIKAEPAAGRPIAELDIITLKRINEVIESL